MIFWLRFPFMGLFSEGGPAGYKGEKGWAAAVRPAFNFFL